MAAGCGSQECPGGSLEDVRSQLQLEKAALRSRSILTSELRYGAEPLAAAVAAARGPRWAWYRGSWNATGGLLQDLTETIRGQQLQHYQQWQHQQQLQQELDGGRVGGSGKVLVCCCHMLVRAIFARQFPWNRLLSSSWRRFSREEGIIGGSGGGHNWWRCREEGIIGGGVGNLSVRSREEGIIGGGVVLFVWCLVLDPHSGQGSVAAMMKFCAASSPVFHHAAMMKHGG